MKNPMVAGALSLLQRVVVLIAEMGDVYLRHGIIRQKRYKGFVFEGLAQLERWNRAFVPAGINSI